MPFSRLVLAVLISALIPSFALGSEVTRGDITINAEVFEFDGKRHIIRARGGVTVRKGDMTITGSKAVLKQKQQLLQLEGPVVLTRDDVRLECQTVDVFGATNKVEGRTNVRFFYKDIEGRAQKLVYDLNLKEAVFSGSPVITRGADTLTGEQVIVQLESQKILTKGKTKVFISVEDGSVGL